MSSDRASHGKMENLRNYVLLLGATLLSSLLPLAAAAQTPAPPTPSQVRFGILDNSFLVEEAFNQEAGIFQNIFGFSRSGHGWDFAFTQEWPFKSQKHQLSYTVPFAGEDGRRGIGDVMLNYRLQATLEGPGIPAFSPRLSLILPSGSSGFTLGAPGLQVNLPVSKQRGRLYFHANTGFTWFPQADTQAMTGSAGGVSLLTPHVSGSAIYGVRPMFNLMVET